MDIAQDRPLRPFTVFQDVSGRRVIIPPGEYVGDRRRDISDPSAPVNVAVQTKNGRFYDGDHFGWEFALGVRLGARLISSVGWNRDDIKLLFGSFKNDLVPINVGALVHEPRERAGTHPVQPANGDDLVEHPSGVVESQRHRAVRGLQRSARHL